MTTAWLTENPSEGASTAILLGPLEEETLRTEGESHPDGILWIGPTESPSFPDPPPPRLRVLSRKTPPVALEEAIATFLRLDYDHAPTVKVSSRIEADDPEAYSRILQLIVHQTDATLRARRTRSTTGVLRQECVCHNLAGYLRSRVPETWRRSAEGVLAVVVGAGPSLDATLPILASDDLVRPVIVAADSTLRALASVGLTPDFVTSLDPQKPHASCADPGDHPGIAILSSQSHPSWFRLWGENARFLSGRILTEDWFAAKGVPKTSLLGVNNAGLAALLFADFLNPGAILLAGMDLSSGADGLTRYAQATGRSNILPDASNPHSIPGNYEKTVSTPFLSDWRETSDACAQIATRRHLVNLNDRGAILEGAVLVHPDDASDLKATLAEGLQSFNREETDFAGRRDLGVHGLEQIGSLLVARIDHVWQGLRPLIEDPGANPENKLCFLRETLADEEVSTLLGDYAFAVIPQIAPGKEPAEETVEMWLRDLRRVLWLLEDALVAAEPGEAFLSRFLTGKFA